jgi:putative membrane protein
MAEVTWVAHPDVWLVMTGVVAAYIYAITRLGPRYAPDPQEPATRRQKALFLGGVALMWIGADAPIHDVAEDYLFSVHMVQHLLFTLAAPPLILMGIPAWLYRWALRPKALFGAVRFLTRPMVAFVIFNGLVALTHWPWVVNTSVGNEAFHLGVHTVIVTSALLMWWPVVAPLPELRSLSEPAKMLYLFGQSILPTVPASFLTFADKAIYSSYASFPRLWGLSAETDQMIAGLIMKLGGGLLLWGVIAVVFFRWYSREEGGLQTAVGWEDFERSLDAWDLRRT